MLCTRSVKPSQIGPKCFEIFSERAVVDQGVADRRHAAGLPQHVAAHQHAAAGRACCRTTRIVDPGERVKHLKEENEGRDEQPLGKTFATQFHHQRSQNETTRLRAGNEACENVRLIDNVGVGEEQVVRRKRHGLGKLDTLLLRPQLAGPSGRQCAPRHHSEALGSAERGRGVARDKGCAVAALVVDQNHMERAGIVLPDQRGDGLGHACGLVARRNNGGDGWTRTVRGAGPRRAVVIAPGRQPESAPRRKQVQPDRQHH